MRPSLGALLLADAVALWHAWKLSRTLPALVASHFDAAGHVNGWATRGGFLTVYLVTVGLLTVGFVGAGMLTVGRPDAALRVPNPDLWLAPERREKSFAWVRAWLEWTGTGAVVLTIVVMRLIARFNADPTRPFGGAFMGTLVVFTGFVVAMILAFQLRFSRTR